MAAAATYYSSSAAVAASSSSAATASGGQPRVAVCLSGQLLQDRQGQSAMAFLQDGYHGTGIDLRVGDNSQAIF